VLKEELMKRLWPDTFVEESNLTFNIQQLRKALGDNARKPIYVETIPRRGYRFIAGVEIAPANQPNETAPAPSTTDVLIAPQVVAPTRARVAAILTLIGIAIATIGLVYWTVARRGGESSMGSKRIDSKAGKGLTLTGLTATGQSRHVAISPDGKYVAYTRNSQNLASIWVRQLASNSNVQIVTADRVAGLEFANSGESLYFVKGDPTALYRVSLIGGVPTKIIDVLEATSLFHPTIVG